MNTIKKLIGFLTLVLFFSCNETDKNYEEEIKGKLSSDLVHNENSLDPKNNKVGQAGKLVFTDTTHAFGKITEGETVSYEFTYSNVGGKDVIIHSAKAGCGCTVPEYNRDKPIKPGETGTIKVSFNSTGKPGHQNKSVLVITNASPSEYTINIEADVN